MGDIGKYFNKSEFTCQCGCGKDDISGHMVHIMGKVREILGRPLVVTSGCRCSEHNRQEKGKEDSAHVKGLAADLKVNNSRERFEVLQALLTLGIARIGIAKTFIHVDIDDSKPPQVVWLY